MDPLSVAASTIALVELGLKLVKGLEILRDFSHIPDDIAALIDELRDLQDVLTAVCVATKQRASVEGLGECSDELKSLLAKAGTTLSSIASHCGISVGSRHDFDHPQVDLATVADSQPNVDLLTRFRWLKDRKKINYYRQRLKIVRLDIGNHLASLSLVDSCSVLVELRDLAAAFRKLSIDHSNLHATIKEARPLLNTSRILDDEDLTESPIFPPTYSMAIASSPVTAPEKSLASHDKALPLSTCSCSCHKVSKLASPGFVQPVIGNLTISVGGLSLTTPACDEIACKRSMHSSVKISYRFPSWFSSSALHSMVYNSRMTGPQMSLTSTRTVPRTSDLFTFAKQGNVAGVQGLFTRGLASPFDVTHNYGYTALHYAADYGHHDLCHFLLKAGAKAEIQDFDGQTATDIAYHKMCAPSFDHLRAENVRSLFDQQSWLEEKQFTSLHKIVLQLTDTPRSLRDQLLVSTKEINRPDSTGRTPLSWAAEHCDQEAVSTLLKFGADLHKANNDGNTPLHYSCSSEGGTPEVLQTLLAAGADPTRRNKWGQTSLNWISFHQDDPNFVKPLLAYPNVDLFETDNHGTTAIGNASFRSNNRMLSFLIDCGVNFDTVAADATTALLDCISANNHGSLSVLLEKSSQCGLRLGPADWQGESCLHYLARHADQTTVEIFSQALIGRKVGIGGLDTTQVGTDGLTVRDLLSLRGDPEIREMMNPVLRFVDQEVESEKNSLHSPTEAEILFVDAEEFLPQLEKDIGVKGGPRIAIKEIEVVSPV